METDLQILEAEIEFLPELAEDWDRETAQSHLEWRWEWWDLMGRLKEIHAAYLAGKLNEEQVRRYQNLSLRLAELIPLIDRLGFPHPPVLLKP